MESRSVSAILRPFQNLTGTLLMTHIPSAPPPLSEEEQARLESSKRLVSYMLLAMGVGVVGVIAFGLYRMAALIIANS